MTPLYLMRHGAPALTGRMLGRTDAPATTEGIAACVAQGADLSVERIVASDLRRASASAKAIAGDRAVTIDPRWREIDFGEWDGLAIRDVDAAALEAFWDDPDGRPPPGGERWSALTARVGAALGEIEGPTLVVTHGGAMRAALSVLCGFDHRRCWAFDLPYASVIALDLWRGETPSAQIKALWP